MCIYAQRVYLYVRYVVAHTHIVIDTHTRYIAYTLYDIVSSRSYSCPDRVHKPINCYGGGQQGCAFVREESQRKLVN